MKRILLSLMIIAGAGTALAIGSTGAYFSDTEASVGNVFTAGAIDLKVDNESYVTSTTTGQLAFNPGTSWAATDITNQKFFNFDDVKPGDIGEDTISLHVNNNDAWSCMNAVLTATPENGVNPVEANAGDVTSGANDGELQNQLYFVFWADDGDNVFESDETSHIIKEGLAKDIFAPGNANWTLADSNSSVFNPAGPLLGNKDYFIGKAWCVGTMTKTPITQDGIGKTGTGIGDSTNGPLVRGTGFNCAGAGASNVSQTDGISVDVTFTATQARNNASYLCAPAQSGLTLKKVVDNTGGGTALATDWTLSATGPTNISGITGSASVTNATVAPGIYTLAESAGPANYSATKYSCVINGGAPVLSNTVTVGANQTVVCTITNMFQANPAKLTITKVVVNSHGGNNVVSDFALSALNNANAVSYPDTSGVQINVPADAGGTTYTIKESGVSGYQATFSGDCDSGTHKVVLHPGDVKACTITNQDLPPNITLIKNVTGTGTLAAPEDFDMTIDGTIVPNNTSFAVTSNSPHAINEDTTFPTGYSFVSITGSAKCPAVLNGTATLNEGEAITCTITNHKN